MGSPGKTSNTATVQAITTHLDLPKGAGPQAVRRTLVRKRKREEQQKAARSSSSSGDCTVRRPRRAGKPKVGLAVAKMFAHAVRMGMGQRQLSYAVNAMLKKNSKATATSPKFVKDANMRVQIQLRRSCSEARRSVGAVAGSADLSGPKK